MDTVLGRTAATEATARLGWRFLLGALRTVVQVDSPARGADIARLVVGIVDDNSDDHADDHLRIDHRPGRLILTLQSTSTAAVTGRDVELATKITEGVRNAGLDTGPELGTAAARSVQIMEIAIDAVDIAAIRPFWKALLGYVDEPGHDGPTDPLVGPVRSMSVHLVPTDGCAPAAAQSDPFRRVRSAR